jgi:phosphate starvation-inducible PhoH-like protein
VLFGLGDRNLKLLRDTLGVDLTARGRKLRLAGEIAFVEKAASLLNRMMSLYRSGVEIGPDHLEQQLATNRDPGTERSGAIASSRERGGFPPPSLPPKGRDGDSGSPGPDSSDNSEAPSEGSSARETEKLHRALIAACSRSPGQEAYMDAMVKNALVFCIGPAGTGKTFLAVRMAVHLLRAGDIRRIILCRPAVEAGEKLGFLPGDFQAKINPYLRPLYDALNDILEFDQVKRYMERQIIEIIPLAYMRGRTLNNALVILDEGQNTSVIQMKMFLTRMGMNSRIVVNGDITQVDLPKGQESGLVHAEKIVRNIEGVSWVRMGKADIVRHPLVRKIVAAYEVAGSNQAAGKKRRR